jgi:hypothetical protein
VPRGSLIGPCPGSTAQGSTSAHGTRTNARSAARGCGSSNPLGTGRRPARRPRQGAGAPADAPLATGRHLRRCAPAPGRRASRSHSSTALRKSSCSTPPTGRRLVDRRDGVRARAPRRQPQLRQPVAQVAADRQHRRHGRTSVTLTSSKTAGSARRLVHGDLGRCTRSSARQTAASRSASASDQVDRLAGHDRGQPLGQLAVVDGVGHVVDGRGRAGRGAARRRRGSPALLALLRQDAVPAGPAGRSA